MRLPIDGAVLAGGQSQRMGSPKELLVLPEQVTFLGRARRILSEALSGTIWVSRPYGFVPETIFDVPDTRAHRGPLSGILEVLSRASSPMVAVLAVDLPNVPVTLWSLLYDAWRARPDSGVVYPVAGDDTQPLAALWSRAAIPAIAASLGDDRVPKVIDVVRALNPTHVLLQDREWLANINTPDDLTRISRRWHA